MARSKHDTYTAADRYERRANRRRRPSERRTGTRHGVIRTAILEGV